MSINKENYIDFYNREYIVFHANQFDNDSRTITLTPKNGSEILNLKDWTPRLLYYKPDGHAGFYDLSFQENGSITIEFTDQMLSVPGDCIGQLYLSNSTNSEIITSTTFLVKVNKRLEADNVIESSDEFNALNTMILSIDEAYQKGGNVIEMADQCKTVYNHAVQAGALADEALTNANNAIDTANSINSTAAESAEKAKQSEIAAADSAKAALQSETNAKTSEENSGKSEANAGKSASAALLSEQNAKASELLAEEYKDNSYNYASQAKESTEQAKASEDIASAKADAADTSSKSANNQAILAESYLHGGTGTRDNEDEDCVVSYYNKIKSVTDIDIANAEKAGLVKSGSDVNVGIDGTMSIPKLTELEHLIKNAGGGKSADTVEEMVTILNNAASDAYRVPTGFFIKASRVTDFWISDVYESSIEYTYTTDEALVNDILTNNSIQIGYYGVSCLETKVDLDGYATETYVNTKSNEIKSYTDNQIASLDKNSIGLGNVENVSVSNQIPAFSEAGALEKIANGEKNSTLWGKAAKAISSLIYHLSNTSNPHAVTKSQIGLNNVENKSSADIRNELTISNIVTALGYTPPKSDTNTTYSAGAGISLSGTTFSNSGVRSISSGLNNGTIIVNTNGVNNEVRVPGLDSAAYTKATDYASSSHTHLYAGSPSAGGDASRALCLKSNDSEDNVYFNYYHDLGTDVGYIVAFNPAPGHTNKMGPLKIGDLKTILGIPSVPTQLNGEVTFVADSADYSFDIDFGDTFSNRPVFQFSRSFDPDDGGDILISSLDNDKVTLRCLSTWGSGIWKETIHWSAIGF